MWSIIIGDHFLGYMTSIIWGGLEMVKYRDCTNIFAVSKWTLGKKSVIFCHFCFQKLQQKQHCVCKYSPTIVQLRCYVSCSCKKTWPYFFQATAQFSYGYTSSWVAYTIVFLCQFQVSKMSRSFLPRPLIMWRLKNLKRICWSRRLYGNKNGWFTPEKKTFSSHFTERNTDCVRFYECN